MPTTIAIPKKALEDVLAAGRRFVAAEDALEDALLASKPAFIKKMRRLRAEHLRGNIEQWQLLKTTRGGWLAASATQLRSLSLIRRNPPLRAPITRRACV